MTPPRWAVAAATGAAAMTVLAALLVLAARWAVGLEPVRDFQARYPGAYELPAGAPQGVPVWLGWQHFLNAFLMVLIIRSGLRVRYEKKAPAMWSPRRNKDLKMSLTLWLHQSLDVLWLVNGVVFFILIFATGQWMRVVPTSWEVFPNAISALLHYVSLDWPTENGWVNYNSLQQLAYVTTIFVAAPLAAVSGFRMSQMWPARFQRLGAAFPVEAARKIHVPVMVYFVVFIATHVALVFATGALRNLNHMYAAQGSVDPNQFAENWTGFWMFTASLVVIALGWLACRPLLLVPVARLFGTVRAR